MSSSNNAETVCPAAVVYDLRELGVTFPGAAVDCGSENCPQCVQRRTNNNTTSADTETEAQKQDRLSRAIEGFFENPEAMVIPADGEGNESSGLIASRVVESDLDALYEDASARELASINEILWNAADAEQPQMLNDLDARCGLEEDYQIDFNEAQIGLAHIDNA